MIRNVVGKQIRDARKRLKPPLTQVKLAAKLESRGWKISRDMIAKIEIGEREVTDIELMALAQVLKVSIESLINKQLFEKISKEK